ncbi:hypothetical protein ACTGYW_09580, partial [Streptococcus suis]
KKIVQDNRDKKKNTDSTAGFHQNQLESICVFYLLASFCPASLFYAQVIGVDGNVGRKKLLFYLLLCVSINTNRGSLFDFQWPYRELKFKNVIREKI